MLCGLYAMGFPGVAHGPMPADIRRKDGEAAVDGDTVKLAPGCTYTLTGAYAGDDGLLRLQCALAYPDGSELIRAEATGLVESPLEVAAALETIMRSRGAEEILAELQPRRIKPARNGHSRKTRAKKSKRAKARR